MRNSWPETVDELLAECKALEDRDLYTLGEKGEPYYGEDEPRVDGTDYLAGEYQYGVMMIPAQWVTHVISDATLGAGTCHRVRGHRSYRTQGGYRIECSECGYGLADKRYNYCPNCGRKVVDE